MASPRSHGLLFASFSVAPYHYRRSFESFFVSGPGSLWLDVEGALALSIVIVSLPLSQAHPIRLMLY